MGAKLTGGAAARERASRSRAADSTTSLLSARFLLKLMPMGRTASAPTA